MNQKPNIKQHQSGQILLVVLLIMLVGLTVGLFSVSRTTTDISLTTTTTESSIAFNAAEAGIEEALRDASTIIQNSPYPIGSANYNVVVADYGSSGIFPSSKQSATAAGSAFTLWLVPHDDTTGLLDESSWYQGPNLDICFSSNSPEPAIGLTLFYRDLTNGIIRVTYNGFDPVSRGNGFQAVEGTIGVCGAYNYRARIDFPSHFGINAAPGQDRIPLALRIRPVYNSTSIAVSPVGQNFPKQGNDISSTGNVGEVTRKINVLELYGAPPPFMDYVIYSKSNSEDLTK